MDYRLVVVSSTHRLKTQSARLSMYSYCRATHVNSDETIHVCLHVVGFILIPEGDRVCACMSCMLCMRVCGCSRLMPL